MFCGNCGKKLEDGAAKCPDCGTSVPESMRTKPAGSQGAGSTQSASSQESGNTAGGGTSGSGGNTGKGGSKKGYVLLGGAVVVIAAGVLIWQGMFRSQRLTAEDYVDYMVSGLDSEGTAALYFDSEGLLADIQAKKDLTQGEQKDIRRILEGEEEPFTADPGKDLSNGDTVTVKSELDKNLLKKYRIVLKSAPLKFQVSGLTEIKTISLKDYVTLNFSGFEGHGSGWTTIDWDRLREDAAEKIREADSSKEAEDFIENDLMSYLYGIYTDVNSLTDLKNGDTAKITIQAEQPEITRYGVRFEASEVSGTVEGLVKTEEVALEDYVTWNITGFNGAGSAEISLDKEKLQEDLAEKFMEDGRGVYGSIDSEDWSDSESEGEEGQYYQAAGEAANMVESGWRESFQTSFGKDEDLANGDVLTLNCTSQEESVYLSSVGITLKGFSKEVSVENLEEPKEIDLAEDIQVTFTGTCPDVYAEVVTDMDTPYAGDTSLADLYSRSIQAENGDVFEGEIEYDAEELLREGYVVTNAHYSFPIEGLPTYNFTFEDFNSQNLEPVKQLGVEQAKNLTGEDDSWVLDHTGDGTGWVQWDQVSMELTGGMKAYRGEDGWDYNRLIFQWTETIPVKLRDRTIETRTLYFAISLENVTESPDGELSWENWRDDLSESKEEVDQWITEQMEDLGENPEITELTAVSSGEAEESQTSGTVEDSETAAVEVMTEAKVENDSDQTAGTLDVMAAALTRQAPELPADIAAQAAAVISWNGHTYARFEQELAWEDAEAFCEKAGGHLMVITSEAENIVAEKLIQNGDHDTYWLGATDKNWEGAWKWVTGEDFSWTSWQSGQPDNSTNSDEVGENYLEISSWNSGEWNDNSNSEEAGFLLELEPEETSEEEMVSLTELAASGQRNSGIQDYFEDSYGNSHYSSQYLDASEDGWISWDLNGEWDVFGTNISTWSDAESGASFDLAVWADGKLIYSLYDYQKTDVPQSVVLSVAGVQKLTIQTCNRGDYGNGYLFLSEGRLCKAAEPQTSQTAITSINDVTWMDADECTMESGTWTDVYGNLHENAVHINAASSGNGTWNLNGAYTKITGVLASGEEAYNEETAVHVEILADGEKIFETDGFEKFQGLLPFEADVTGKKLLQIQAQIQDTYNRISVNAADIFLEGTAVETETAAAAEPEFPQEVQVLDDLAAAVYTGRNFRYYRIDEPMTWEQASSFAKAAGGSLAVLKDLEHQRAAEYLVSNGLYREYWIGAARSGKNWMWADASSVDDGYTNWSSGQPDNAEDKEFLMTMYQDGTWNDAAAEITTGFVVEVKAVSAEDAAEGTALCDLEWADSSDADVENTRDSRGKVHLSSPYLNASEKGWISVNLNGQYSTFEGNVTVYANAFQGVNMTLAIFGDGSLLYELNGCTRNKEAVPFTVDVTGIRTLTISSKNDGTYDGGYLYLNEAVLIPTEGEAEAEQTVRLSELVSVDQVETDSGKKLFTDAFGNVYDGYLCLNMAYAETASTVYNLEGRYAAFSGVFTSSSDSVGSASVNISIYGDGELLFEEKDYQKADGPLAFTVDVTGKTALEIRTETSESDSGAKIYLESDSVNF